MVNQHGRRMNDACPSGQILDDLLIHEANSEMSKCPPEESAGMGGAEIQASLLPLPSDDK